MNGEKIRIDTKKNIVYSTFNAGATESVLLNGEVTCASLYFSILCIYFSMFGVKGVTYWKKRKTNLCSFFA